MPTPREFRIVLSSITMFEKPFSYSTPSASSRNPSRVMRQLLRKPSMWQLRTVMLESPTSAVAWI